MCKWQHINHFQINPDIFIYVYLLISVGKNTTVPYILYKPYLYSYQKSANFHPYSLMNKIF